MELIKDIGFDFTKLRDYTEWIYNKQYTVEIQLVPAQMTLSGKSCLGWYQYQIKDSKTGITVREGWGFKTLEEVYHEINLEAKYHLNKGQ